MTKRGGGEGQVIRKKKEYRKTRRDAASALAEGMETGTRKGNGRKRNNVRKGACVAGL